MVDSKPLVTEAVVSLVDAWSVFARRFPGGRVERLDGVTVTWADKPLPFLNLGIVDSPCTDRDELRRRLGALVGHVAGEQHPWFAALCEEWAPEGWKEVAADAGLHVAMALTGMVVDQLVPPRRPPPALDLRRVDDAESRRAVAELNNSAYGLPDGMCDALAEGVFWPADMYGFVGSVDGEDVCTTSVFPALGTAYVALVATHPHHGRKGYAEHVMRHALAESGGALDLPRSTLHATDAGRPVYASMGYETSARFALLSTASPADSAGGASDTMRPAARG